MKKSSLLIFLAVATKIMLATPTVDTHIKTDQFGYRTTDKKIAVISNPITGYNSNSPFTPGNTYEIKRFSDDITVFSGSITTWNSGATHSQSGDKVWWFDFSSLTTPGTYYVFDVTNNVRSYEFDINDCVYYNVLKQTFKMFYYQRCGSAKTSPFALNGYSDVACHKGNLQDTDCRLYNNTNASTSKDLSGGWHDAGDYNKYVNFTFETMMDVLLAYGENPTVWGDNFNVPESGNSIPDILDEAKYELDWLLKMQNTNGSVLCVVGVSGFAGGSPPSTDVTQRVYGPATTSATFTASALFALAAIQFKSIGQNAYATTLENAAINAWNWATANPNVQFYNTGVVAAGEQEVSAYETLVRQMAAAAFLYAHTNNTTYKTFFENNYTQMHLIQWTYAYPFEEGQQNFMLYYASLNGATTSVANTIENAYKNSMQTNNADNLPAYTNKTDAYRAFLADNNYTWGSNTTKGRQGIMFTNMLTYNLDATNNTSYQEAALGIINYFHGVNPNAYCYLSNMGNYGSENSITEFYHEWFKDGSALWDKVGVSTYGPAPGYLIGGVNPTYALDGCCPNNCGASNSLCNTSFVTPPLGQPIQKSFKDWNTSWPQNSWTISEAGIYTQASYIRLLSRFVTAPCIISSGINEGNNNILSISVFPNPATNEINIISNKKEEMIIRNILGENVYEYTLKSGNNIINIETLSKGLYFIEVHSKNKIISKKLIVN